VGMRRYAEDRRGAHAYYIAAGLTLWVAWHAAMIAGAAVGAGVPEWISLQHAVPLFLLAEVVGAARARPAAVAALVGAAATVFGGGLPLHSGLLVGIVLGVSAAVLVERRTP
jgi:predicted branched-subunit amino acid permease